MSAHTHHTHSHHHHAVHDQLRWAFAIGISINVAFAVIEWLAGVMANSLALIADATHNFSDVLGLAAAWTAAILARRPPSARFTYGLRSSTILAALGNAMILLVAIGGIAWEALQRFDNVAAVNGPIMIWVAALGTLINAGTAMLFLRQRHHDLNVRGAYLHMAADAAVSLGVVVTGIAMYFTQWRWLDPVVSLLIVTVIFVGTWGLLRDAMKLALQAAPSNVDPMRVRQYLSQLPGVNEVHDLHIWAMSTTETALTAHLVMPGGQPGDAFLNSVVRHMAAAFHIGHTTIQIEVGTCADQCTLAAEKAMELGAKVS